ncbi:hypothetical protein E4U17_000954, partial [Claviceps sp. LM77 group G4]
MALVMGQPIESNDLRRRIQELEQEVQEKDNALKQEIQRALQQILQKAPVTEWHNQERQRHMQERNSKLQQVPQSAREVHVIEPRPFKRWQRDLLRQRQIRKRQIALQQERDLALQEAEEKGKELQRAEKRERQAKERARALKQEKDRALQQAKERTRALQKENDR